ncbi:hypothetical protein [Armatimonas sp.]|uniref:hypothetical protein n=1 Tax=Armatimonas sp. TaxID=1872638 RepID=UPI0037517369
MLLLPLPALVQLVQPLSSLWERLHWSVEARGALIAVGIEAREPLPNFPVLLPGPQNATDLLARYDATLVRYGSISAVATRTMRVYDPPRSPVALAEKLRDINPEPYWLLLLASLNPGQWQQLTGPPGLLLSALETRQRRWLESALPESASFRTREALSLDPRDFRLRLTRQLTISVGGKEVGDAYFPTGLAALSEESVVTLPLREGVQPGDEDEQFLGRRLAPGKSKPTDLDTRLPALQTSVLLEDVTSVGALVKRLAAVTQLPLMADALLAKRSVRVLGKRALAGDVLAALCRGVNGGMRRVGSVYLLVEDLPSAAARRERANLDYQRFLAPQEQEVQQLSQLAAAARSRLIREGALKKIPRSTQDAPEALWALAERFDTEERIPFAQLSATLRTEVQALAVEQQERVERFGGVLPPVPTEAHAEQKLVLELLAPAAQGAALVAELSAELLRSDEPLPEPQGPLVIPETLKTRAWQVALPEDDSAQDALLSLAKRTKLTQLRIVLRPHPLAEKRLAALARAAKTAGIGVVPVFSPFLAFSATTARERGAGGQTLEQWAAINATDETPSSRLARSLVRWDFVVPEALDLAGVVGFAARLAALPGVVGLGLEGVTPPGYPDAEVGDWALWIGGFALERRLAFVRAHQTDPADLISASPFNIESEPQERTELREIWEAEQRQRRDRALLRLHQALLAAKLPVPLSVRAGALGKSGHWQRWRGHVEPTTGERSPLVPEDAHPGLLHVSVIAYDVRVSGLGANLSALFDATAQFRSWLDLELQPALRPTPDHPDHWDGFVIDVSDRSLAVALLVLEKAFEPS